MARGAIRARWHAPLGGRVAAAVMTALKAATKVAAHLSRPSFSWGVAGDACPHQTSIEANTHRGRKGAAGEAAATAAPAATAERAAVGWWGRAEGTAAMKAARVG